MRKGSSKSQTCAKRGRQRPPTHCISLFPVVVLLHVHFVASHFSENCEIVEEAVVKAEKTLRKGLSIIQELSQLRRKTPCKYLFQGKAIALKQHTIPASHG